MTGSTLRSNFGCPAHMSTPTPAAEEVIILHSAVALDGSKTLVQKSICPRNTITSQSLAGTIVQIGENVTRFALGQRVIAYSQLRKVGIHRPNAGLQQYSAVPQSLVSTIPDSLELHEAVTLPLPVTLAAVGLYQRNHLNLPLPGIHSEKGTEEEGHTEKVILILDGASKIGALAIQLATASGVRVIATASKPDVSFVQSLGANIVIDERDLSAARAEIVAALGMGTVQLSGIFDTRSTEQSFAQVDALLQDIAQNPPVCAVKPPARPPRSFVPTVAISSTINRDPYTFIRSAVWGKYLPEALESGRLCVRPGQIVRSAETSGAFDAADALKRQCADGIVVLSYE